MKLLSKWYDFFTTYGQLLGNIQYQVTAEYLPYDKFYHPFSKEPHIHISVVDGGQTENALKSCFTMEFLEYGFLNQQELYLHYFKEQNIPSVNFEICLQSQNFNICQKEYLLC